MYARSTIIRGNPQSIDDGIAYMRDESLPTLQEMDGFVGLSMLAERDTGRCIIATAWASEEAMNASADRVRPMRERVAEKLNGQAEMQGWEIAVLHREHPAGDGAAARVTWVRTAPDRMEELLDGYRTTLMPRYQELPGFCSLSMLVDRQSGRAVGVTTFESRDALDRSREQTRSLREIFTPTVRAEIMEVAEMDLVLAHLRVPETV
jgi:heme-degrading monooxygenase HmoA